MPQGARAAGPRAGPGEQVDVGRRRFLRQLGPRRVPRPQGDQQDERGQGHLRRQGRRQGLQQRGDVGAAEDALDKALEKFTDLETEFQCEVETLEATRRPEALAIQAHRAGPQEGRHHRRAGRPGLDAVEGEAGGKPEAAY